MMRRTLRYAGISFVLFGMALLGTALGGQFRVAGVQVTGSAIKSAQNTAGFQVRMCVTMQPCALKASASKQYSLRIGLFDEAPVAEAPIKIYNAARNWALYE